jgi:tryptophan-rich sensory protein
VQSLLDVIALQAQSLGYITSAKEMDPAATACFICCAAWGAFATVLKAEIARRNPDATDLLPQAPQL